MGKKYEVSIKLTGDAGGAVAAARKAEEAHERLGKTIEGTGDDIVRANKRLADLGKQATDLKGDFDQGKISVDKYAKSMDELDDEARKLKSSFGQAEKSTESLKSKFSSAAATIKKNALVITAAVAATVIALRGLARAVTATVSAAFEQERAVRAMNAALKLSGDFSKAASSDMQAFAVALAKVNATTDQAVLRGLALAKSFGATNDQAKIMVSTAQDFAVAADINFVESLRRIGRATQGSTEDIAKFAPEILNLTRVQLAAGEGTDILAARFKGLSAELAAGAEGAVKNIGIAFGEMKERVGEAIIANDGVTAAISRLREVLQDQGTVDSVAALASNMVELGVGTVTAVSAMREFLGPADAISQALEEGNKRFKEIEKSTDTWAGTLVAKATTALKSWTAGIRENLGLMPAWEGGITRVKMATDELTLAQEREARILKSVEKAQSALLTTSQRLGIVLEKDVLKKIEANNKVLVDYENLLDGNKITGEDFARAQVAIATANEELRASLLPVTDGVQHLAEAYNAAGPSIDRATAATDRFADSTRNSTEALRANEEQANRSQNILGGASDSAQLSGGTFTFPGPTVAQDPDGRLRAIGPAPRRARGYLG